jgi:hypothetical protein
MTDIIEKINIFLAADADALSHLGRGDITVTITPTVLLVPTLRLRT